MQSLTYLAVFEPSTDVSYSIYFPDLPGCISIGANLQDASRMAAKAASLHIYRIRGWRNMLLRQPLVFM